MRNKTIISIFSIIAFAAICFSTCAIENPIIEKWWVEPKPEEPEYVPLTKYLPGTYDTIIEEKIVYKTIFVQLPPETIIEYVYEQLPPEIIYQTITVPEYITVYQDVIKYIEVEVPAPITKEKIIEWLKDPANEDDVKEIIKIIKDKIPEDVIKEIIKEIPPKDIVEYLTDEQIQYIVKQQPPHKILQSIKIIDIEYVIFAGDSSVVNSDHGSGANTNLTDQEKAFNSQSIKEMAKQLNEHSNYLIMLHGHANPVTFTDGEKGDLTKLSIDRANDVRRVLLTEYKGIPPKPDNPSFDDRVSCSGYGGEKTLFGNNTSYTALNRRVEMILFEIITTVDS